MLTFIMGIVKHCGIAVGISAAWVSCSNPEPAAGRVADTELMPQAICVKDVVAAGRKQQVPQTSQSPAVKLKNGVVITFAEVAVVSDVPGVAMVAVMVSPTQPALGSDV